MANQSSPILEKQVKLNNTVGQAPFTQAFDNMALSPTALGEFGANLAITASTALAQRNGYEAGKNPHGTLLPPITRTDRAYQQAYIAQSQNTLGLQATKLMLEGQAEINSSYNLTPDMIASYTKNVSEGLNDIINNAPIQAQPGLAAQFGSSLLRSKANLNDKMVSQQKQQALQDATVYNNSQLSSIYDTARSGNIKAAEIIQGNMEMRINSMSESGMITPLQAESAKKSARMSYYTGMYTGEAIAAFNNKEDDQFLADLLAKKPKGIPVLEWESIAKNVMNEVQVQESFNHRNENSLYSEANRLLSEGTLTSDFIAQLESETTSKPKFNNFMSQVAVYQRSNHSTNQKLMALTQNWTNPDVMAVADEKTKNLALVQATQDVKQKAADNKRTIDDFQAQVEAMSTVPVPIQDFTSIMNTGLTSGNPDIMLRNQQAYRQLSNSNPIALDNISKNAKAMLSIFESEMTNGNAPDVAALNAKTIVMNKDETQVKINDAGYKQWYNATINTPSRLNSWASQFADIGDGASINNLPAFAMKVEQMFKENMFLTNNDVENASKMTKDGIARAWGKTTINGKPEIVFQPLEKTIGLDEGANPLIKNDLYEQLKTQIEPMNAAYHDGKAKKDLRMSFRYELVERPTYEQYRQAQSLIAKRKMHKEITNSHISPFSSITPNIKEDKEYDEALNTINRFKDENIKIKRIYDGGHEEEFEVAIAANPGLQQDPKTGIIGSYNVSMRKNNGPSAPMNGWFRGPLSEPIYRPNQWQIRQRYFDLVGLNPSGKSVKEIYKDYLTVKSAREEAKAHEGVNQLGRGFR